MVLTEKQCYIAALNRIYQNPPSETATLDCIAAQRRLPCSLCAEREDLHPTFSAPPLPAGIELPLFISPPVNPISPQEKKLKLTKKEREQAEPALAEFGETVRRAERRNAAHRNRPKSSFFPQSIMNSVLDSLLALDSLETLQTAVQSWVFSRGYVVRLYVVVHELRTTINSQRDTARLEKNAKQRATRQKKKGIYVSESEDESEMESEESDEEVDEHPRSSPIPPSPKQRRRILEEVTNKGVRAPTKRAVRKPLQRAAEVSESYSAPYRTSRRRAAQNE